MLASTEQSQQVFWLADQRLGIATIARAVGLPMKTVARLLRRRHREQARRHAHAQRQLARSYRCCWPDLALNKNGRPVGFVEHGKVRPYRPRWARQRGPCGGRDPDYSRFDRARYQSVDEEYHAEMQPYRKAA